MAMYYLVGLRLLLHGLDSVDLGVARFIVRSNSIFFSSQIFDTKPWNVQLFDLELHLIMY